MLPVYELVGLAGALSDELSIPTSEEAEIGYTQRKYDKFEDIPLQRIQKVSLQQLAQKPKRKYLRPFEQWVQDVRNGKRDINDL